MNIVQVALLVSPISFILSYFSTKVFMEKMLKKGYTSIDVHKTKKVKVPTFGGVGFVLSFIVSLFLLLALAHVFNVKAELMYILVAASSTSAMGLIALVDDVLKLSWLDSIVLPIIAALPLMASQVGVTKMIFPIIGEVNLGFLYYLAFIPLLFIFSTNATNMLAGYNGLEAGLGIINLSYLALISYLFSRPIGIVLSILGIAVLAGFYMWNKYPAKVFPGDVGTYSIGAMLATIIVLANIEKLGILMLTLYGINFLLFLFMVYKVKFKGMKYYKFASVSKEGYIKPHNPYTVYWVFPYFFKLNEKQATRVIFLTQILLNAALLIAFL